MLVLEHIPPMGRVESTDERIKFKVSMIENLFPGGVVSLAAPGRATADCQCPVSGSLYN